MKILPNRKGDRANIYWNESFSSRKIAELLFSLLPKESSVPIALFCIGTDRSSGDSLGPLVGTHLLEKTLPENFHVFGTLEDPVHAVNLKEKLEEVNRALAQPFIIAVDACLGRPENVGTISVKPGPLKPGAAMQKDLPFVGHSHITGIVNAGGLMEFFILQNTRLYLVMALAKTITEGIYQAGLLYQSRIEGRKAE